MKRRTLGRAMVMGLCSAAAPVAMSAQSASSALAVDATPDFSLKRWNGANLRLHEQRGQVVMVNFWATWCAPCRQEMPHLNRLHDQYRASGFVLLGVNVDDDPGKAVALAQSLGLRFAVLFDTDKAVARAWNLGAMPSTVLMGRDGRVRHIHRGYREGLETSYETQVRSLLKE